MADGRWQMAGAGRRFVAVWASLFVVYCATLGFDAFPGSDYGGDEPHYLLAAHSLVEDGDLDVADEYRARAYAGFYPLELDMHGAPREDGSLHEPHGAGFPLLIAPAFALGGPSAVEIALAALAALGGAFAYLLARRVAPDAYALGAALVVGLSPLFLAYGAAVYPELAVGAVLAGAALLALRLESRAAAFGCLGLLATLPWLGTKFVPAGAVIGLFALRALWRAGRRGLALGGAGLAVASAIGYALANLALYDGVTPYAADVPGESATDAGSLAGYLERAYRLAALLVDRDYGLFRWAPVLALALVGVWLLLREPSGSPRRSAAGLCAIALAAQLAVAAFLAPTMFGFWFPGRHVIAALPLAIPLAAWGLWRFPRIGAALGALTLAGSVWLYADVRLGEGALVSALPPAPWGPLEALFPFFDGTVLPYVLTALAGAAVALLALIAARHSRHTAGATRARYSG